MKTEAGMVLMPIKEFYRLLDNVRTNAATAEREACAKVVEQYCGAWDDEGYALAAKIRARGAP